MNIMVNRNFLYFGMYAVSDELLPDAMSLDMTPVNEFQFLKLTDEPGVACSRSLASPFMSSDTCLSHAVNEAQWDVNLCLNRWFQIWCHLHDKKGYINEPK